MKNLSRRSFLSLLGIAGGGLAFAGFPKDANAWISFQFADSDIEFLRKLGFNDCLHEDMTQFAYSIVLQRHKTNMTLGDGPASILNPAYEFYPGSGHSPTDYFRENLKLLRIGSYWNDAPVNGLVDFGLSYLAKDEIATWTPANPTKAPYYQDISDIAEHMAQTHVEYPSYRVLMQFSNNERASFLHGMCGVNALGKADSENVSQGTTKKFIMQFLKEAYQYVVENTSPSTTLLQYIDADSQLDTSLDVSKAVDSTGSFTTDTADVAMSTRQIKVRAIGMMCHLIEDSWCPGHTIRCLGDEGFGTILSFGNYLRQNGETTNNHKPYDLYSKVDELRAGGDLRDVLINAMTPHGAAPERTAVNPENFLNNILNWSATSCGLSGGVREACDYFKTLNVKFTIKYLSDFLELIYLNKSWEDDGFYYNPSMDPSVEPIKNAHSSGYTYYSGVGDWIENCLFKTEFNGNGDDASSYICDAGRKTLSTADELDPLIEALTDPIKNFFAENGEAFCAGLENLSQKHKDYVTTTAKFYSDFNVSGSVEPLDVTDCPAATVQTDCFNALKNLFNQNLNFESNNFASFKSQDNLNDASTNPSIYDLLGINDKIRVDFLTSLDEAELKNWTALVNLISGLLQEFQYEMFSGKINQDIVKYAAFFVSKEIPSPHNDDDPEVNDPISDELVGGSPTDTKDSFYLIPK
ncbi:MAG: twin-arginine translocation signal domain-containing protein [Coriobacteriales bacterium]|nr:twin-arginine translocation signal domain-containing protein [Coriobacteriales bacterium]